MGCKRNERIKIIHVNAEALTTGTSIIDASKYMRAPASGLTNTMYATVVGGSDSKEEKSGVVYERTISFATSYFETAMKMYMDVKKNPFTAPNLLQEVLTNLNLGLSNLFGNQWKDEDKAQYSKKRQDLFDAFMKEKPTKDQIKSFKAKYPKIEKDRTFALSTLIRSGYSLGKDWDLHNEQLEIYNGFLRLYNYCKDVAEHTERNKSSVALSLTIEQVEEHLSAAKRIIAWFLKHLYENQVPDHAHEQYWNIFGDDFT